MLASTEVVTWEMTFTSYSWIIHLQGNCIRFRGMSLFSVARKVDRRISNETIIKICYKNVSQEQGRECVNQLFVSMMVIKEHKEKDIVASFFHGPGEGLTRRVYGIY